MKAKDLAKAATFFIAIYWLARIVAATWGPQIMAWIEGVL